MTRGVAHPAHLRAQVVGEVAGGAGINATARKHGLDPSLISRWVSMDLPQLQYENHSKAAYLTAADLRLVMRYFRAALEAMIHQAEVLGDPEYCRSQDAGRLAAAHAVIGDKLAGIARTAAALGLIEQTPGLGFGDSDEAETTSLDAAPTPAT